MPSSRFPSRAPSSPAASRLRCPPSCLAPLALLLALAVACGAHAAGSLASVPVLEGWRYRWGDSPLGRDGVPLWATEAGNAEAWRPVPALQTPPDGDGHTFLWLSLPVPAGDWREPALLLGAVSDAVEVYAGGRRLYASGQLDAQGHATPDTLGAHLVPLPDTALGGRVLLRIQANGGAIGVRQEARVGSRAELLASLLRTNLTPCVLGVLLLGVALVALVAAVLLRQRRMLVALGTFATSGGLLLVGMSNLSTLLWGTSGLDGRLTMLGAYLLTPGLGWFISDALLQGRLRWFRWGLRATAAVNTVLAAAMLVDLGHAERTMGPFILVAMSGTVVCITVAAWEALRGNADARLFVCGLGVFFLFALLSVLPLFGMLMTLGSTLHWGFLALTLSLVGIVARRGAAMVRALAEHTRQLEERQHTVRKLAELMGSGAGELASAVQQLRASNEDQSEGVSRQAAAIFQADAAVAELRVNSQMTAERAGELATASVSAQQVGREGAAAIERTLSNLEAIRGEVSEMAQRILALDERTRVIAGIVDTVKALADQSNMLAVNAAIEAARSGEQGKGFSVVAREVRNLADQSIQATQRIREVLDSLSASMRETAQLSERGEERVRSSLDTARTSGAQLQQLATIIGDTSANVQVIAAAVQQQDGETRAIAGIIQELSNQMQRTLQSVKETQSVAQAVHTLAENMSGMARQALQ